MASFVQREADLSLRAASALSRLRVFWPPDAADGAPIAVFATDSDLGFEAARTLSADCGYIVLALETTELDVVTVALEWAADHGHVLGADPDQLVIAGGALAAAAARRARDNGWPEITRQVLIEDGRVEVQDFSVEVPALAAS